jgi:drug/metabolite transporter (DMT)-like permease
LEEPLIPKHVADYKNTPAKRQKPFLAASLIVVSALFFSGNMFLIKLGSVMEPDASPFLFLAVRSLASTLFLTPFAKHQSKTSLKDSLLSPFAMVPGHQLVIGIGHILWVELCIFVCMSQFPIVMVAIFLNSGPLLSLLLSVPILGEKLNWFDLV